MSDSEKGSWVEENVVNKRDDFKQEIKDLTKHACEIEESFGNVEDTLKEIRDEPTMYPEIVHDINDLLEKWSGHREEFSRLLMLSRDVAGYAYLAVKDYVDVFAPLMILNPSKSLSGDEIKKAIDDRIEHLEEDKTKAQGLLKGFKELTRVIGTFQSKWEALVQKHYLSISEDIAKIDAEIKKIQKELAQLNSIIYQVVDSNSVLKLASKVKGLIAALCPKSWFRVENSDQDGDDSRPSKEETQIRLENELKRLEGEKRDISIKNDAVKKLDKALVDSANDFKNITSRLGKFKKVWGVIQGDLQKTKGELELLAVSHTTSEADKQLFNGRVKEAMELYKFLMEILQYYQTTVDPESDDYE
ncbi:hypothetical protein QCA50_006101 [Cerrena zonata]|uniref:Uncharacterized protein n=1 Tax=Cerrena zonata TaxID=2478898 RepID=A0AAW0GBS8_9APHY